MITTLPSRASRAWRARCARPWPSIRAPKTKYPLRRARSAGKRCDIAGFSRYGCPAFGRCNGIYEDWNRTRVMPTYTVHAPPPRQDETTSAPERFVFVRDGFYFWAFLLAPLWLLLHGLWLALVIYIIGNGAVTVGLTLLGASGTVKFLAGLIVALLVGFEAATIWRWTLARRRWSTLGFVIAEDRETAERRFFAEWVKRAGA